MLKKIFSFVAAAMLIMSVSYADNGKKSNKKQSPQTPPVQPQPAQEKDTEITWTGVFSVETADDGSKTVCIVNDNDHKKYLIKLDEAANRLTSGIKNNSKVQIKGILCEKTDGSSFIQLKGCKLASAVSEEGK